MLGCIKDSHGAVEAMERIQEQSRLIGARLASLQGAVDQIGTMAGAIDAIARQTNLLALNATIEAARAGAAGRGFAVVAAEVKSLSVETGKATNEIRSRVNALTSEMKDISAAVQDSLKSVSSGSGVVKQVGAIIECVGDEVSEVAGRIRSLSELLQQQRSATSEIAENVSRISEKATKTKDEVEAIGRRLQDCEGVVQQALDAGAQCPADNLGLVRFAANATAWKRQHSAILLGMVAATDVPLAAQRALAEAAQLGNSRIADQTIVAELSEAIGAAQRDASAMVAEIRRSNWGAATPAYIACDAALKKAIAAVSRLLQSG